MTMKSTPEESGLYVRNPDVVLRDEDDDGALLFNPDTNQVLVLNATAVLVWKLCDGRNEAAAIASAVKAEFEAAPDANVNADVKKFIEDMLAGGFIGLPR
jgi:hypothetical protein